MQENTVKVNEIDIYTCDSCGGKMQFNPDTQSLVCLYCKGEEKIAVCSDSIVEYDLKDGEERCSLDWGSQIRVIHCDSCGAEIILEPYHTADHCAFCDSSHIVNVDTLPGIRPESIIPFKISQHKAKNKFSAWIKKKFFAPKELKSAHHIDHLMGIYIPYWTYDAHTDSNYSAQKGTYYYVNQTVWVTRNGKRVAENRRVRKIRWQNVSGDYRQFFDDVLIHGSNQIDALLIGKMASFNLQELVAYRPEFLAGFAAEKYSIGLKACWDKAKGVINGRIQQGITAQINGDQVRNLRVNTTFDKTKYKHILLPLWISSYKYKNKDYKFMINGQTGEVQGTSPVSVPKIIAVVLLSLAAIAFIGLLMSHYG